MSLLEPAVTAEMVAIINREYLVKGISAHEAVRHILRLGIPHLSAGVTNPVTIEHDGFVGDIIGSYTTRENKHGLVLQQVGTRVVHVYGMKWIQL